MRVRFRDREVATNPPPSAGGILLAHMLARLDRRPAPPDAGALIEAMRRAHDERTPEFLAGLAEPGFAERFASRLGSTTHIAALDADGWACSVTCSNGEGSGLVVPGTGVHLNNVMGEEDLSPLGYFTHPPGRRLPSMMAPTVVSAGGVPQLVLGSAGSNRIRSALLQVIVNAIDLGMDAREAVAGAAPARRGGHDLRRAGHRPERARGGRRGRRALPRAQPLLRRLPGRRARPRHRHAVGRRRPAQRWRGGARLSENIVQPATRSGR